MIQMTGIQIPPSLGVYGDRGLAEDILGRIWGKRGVFTCTVANTLTSTIPGVSDAGDTPELHASNFDFDDEYILPLGVEFQQKLARLP